MSPDDVEKKKLEGARQLLNQTELPVDQKQRLIARLLEFKDKLAVGQLLAEGLNANQDAQVIQELVEAVGKLGDQSLVPALVPILTEESHPLAAVVLRVMRHLDLRTFLETLAHPEVFPATVAHREFFLRLLTAKQAGACVDLLVEHHSDPEKKLSPEALECLVARGQLEIAPQAWERLARGTDYNAFKALGETLDPFIDADLIRELVTLRRFMAATEGGDLEAQKLRVKRLTTVQKLLTSACEKFDMDPRTLDEQAFDWQTSAMYAEEKPAAATAAPARDAAPANPKSAGRPTGPTATLGTPQTPGTIPAPPADAKRPVAGRPTGRTAAAAPAAPSVPFPVIAFVGILLVLGLLKAIFGGGDDASTTTPVTPDGSPVKGSVHGDKGDVVSLSGKIMQVHASQNAFTMMTGNKALVFVTFRGGFPKPVRGGQEVHVTGVITEVKSVTNLFVAGTELIVSP